MVALFGAVSMNSVFATIQFGPFRTAYHRSAVNQEFREALDAYLTSELLPQVDEPFESTEGTLTPEVNDDQFCGPHSLVRDVYRLRFAFIRPASKDEIDLPIRRRPDGSFGQRWPGQPLYLWTAKRLAKCDEVHDMARRIQKGEKGSWSCPFCRADVRLTDEPSLFDLACTRGCFVFNFHRDPADGGLRHGHFFARPSS